ncbi:hypothetical protein AB1N83_010555 [Pleurotus pulmonarius]
MPVPPLHCTTSLNDRTVRDPTPLWNAFARVAETRPLPDLPPSFSALEIGRELLVGRIMYGKGATQDMDLGPVSRQSSHTPKRHDNFSSS